MAKKIVKKATKAKSSKKGMEKCDCGCCDGMSASKCDCMCGCSDCKCDCEK